VPARLLILLLALLSAQASAQTIILLQSLPVFFTCLAQDQEAANAYFSDKLDSDEYQERWKPMLESEWAACVRRKQWVSKEFCRDILAASKATRSDTARVMEQYQQERMQLKPLYDYFEATRGGAEAKPPSVPPCPG
jgi:hypothetical protein